MEEIGPEYKAKARKAPNKTGRDGLRGSVKVDIKPMIA